MKKIFAIFMLMVVTVTMSGCAAGGGSAGASETEVDVELETVNEASPEFVPFEMELVGKYIIDQGISDDHEFYYYRDTVTDVLYIATHEYRKGGLTIMLDPESGLPLTYTRYMEIYGSKTLTD